MLNRMIGVIIALVMMLLPVSALAQKEPAGRW